MLGKLPVWAVILELCGLVLLALVYAESQGYRGLSVAFHHPSIIRILLLSGVVLVLPALYCMVAGFWKDTERRQKLRRSSDDQ